MADIRTCDLCGALALQRQPRGWDTNDGEFVTMRFEAGGAEPVREIDLCDDCYHRIDYAIVSTPVDRAIITRRDTMDGAA